MLNNDPVNRTINQNEYDYEYNLNNRTMSIKDSKTHRNLTKSVALMRNNQTIDTTIPIGDRSFNYHKTTKNMKSMNKPLPQFKARDDLSVLSGEDEWNEIEKFNAIAEEHDRKMRAVQLRNKKMQFQENLRRQIQEQNKLKQKEILQEHQFALKTLELVKQESLKAEKNKMELKKKLQDRKEMVEKQLKAQEMQKRLFDEEK